MKNLNRYTIIMPIFILLVHIIGCATTTAPKDWLPSTSTAQQESYGGWVSVRYHTGDSEVKVAGELIAVHTNQVLILSNSDMLISIPVDSISGMKMTIHAADSAGLAGWSVLGGLSTLSHGYFIIFSAPVWIITGSNATISTTFDAQMTYPAKPLDAFHAYARFPQGMSKAADMQFLQPKGKKIKIPVSAELLESLQTEQSQSLRDFFFQQNSVQAEAVVAAEEDANTYPDTRHWIDLLRVGSAGKRYAPSLPPRRLLGKSPEYIAFYAAAYSAKAKSLHLKRLWTAQAICCAMSLGGCLIMLSASN